MHMCLCPNWVPNVTLTETCVDIVQTAGGGGELGTLHSFAKLSSPSPACWSSVPIVPSLDPSSGPVRHDSDTHLAI